MTEASGPPEMGSGAESGPLEPGGVSAPLEPDTEARPAERAAGGPSAAPPVPAVESTRRLLGASFDLLTRTSGEMRGASFYIGILVLGSVGPLALASWALEVISLDKSTREMRAILDSEATVWLGILGILAGVGLITAAVESRAMAAAILGSHLVGRPLTVRSSLARSRMVFWQVILGSIIAGIPVLLAQAALSAAFTAALGRQTDVSLVSSTLAAALVGAPFAYVLGGIVLGDVDPVEATRRSIRVFRVRKTSAILVAVFETIATFLVVLGLGAGLDVALRVFGALGLGPRSGVAGQAVITIGVIVGVFAIGTLIYTAYAIVVAPQVVMFVGLTRATMGLDHVRAGGDRDPDSQRIDRRRFRWLTWPLRLGFLLGLVGLVAYLALLPMD